MTSATTGTDPPPSFASGDLIEFWREVRPNHRYLTRDEAPYLFAGYYDIGTVAMFCHRDDVEKLLRDNIHFVNRSAIHPNRRLPPEDSDPPEHERYRRFLDQHFTNRSLARLEPGIATLANRLIDSFIERGECDFIEEFSGPLASGVFMPLMGLPDDGLDTFRASFMDVVRPRGTTPEEMIEFSLRAIGAIYEFFAAALDQHGTQPLEGVVGYLADADLDGDRLTRDEILDISFLMAVAGIDTVKTTLSSEMWHLATHPEHRLQLVADPAVIPTAVEELLRYLSSTPALRRVCAEDVEISGCPIKKGDKVGVSLVSANHDETTFTNPDQVDFTRKPNPHRGFGAGIHHCLGSNLARLELQIAFREWHRRIPDYGVRQGDQPRWLNEGVRSPDFLNLVFAGGPRET